MLPKTLVTGNTLLSVSQAAELLGISRKTVLVWCESGKLPAIPTAYGRKTTYQIPQGALALVVETAKPTPPQVAKAPKSSQPLEALLPAWEHAMARGTLNGRAFSPRTVADYRYYAKGFVSRFACLTPENLRRELARIPAVQFSKREHCFKALVCLGKFLIQEGALEKSFLEDVAPLKPKRHLPAKRVVVTEEGVQALLFACQTPQETALVVLLVNTGLRASELCALQGKDLNLEEGSLWIRCGKGGKSRRVGLNLASIAALKHHLQGNTVPPEAPLFKDKRGNTLTRGGLYQRLERLGKIAGVPASPHALRRAFVTINALKGRPLAVLQRSCGHSSIKTTETYCRISEEEVIQAMKSWD